jgi:hypothetical protein
MVEKVRGRVAAMAFKRNLPPVAEFPGRVDPDRTAGGKAASGAEGSRDGGFH